MITAKTLRIGLVVGVVVLGGLLLGRGFGVPLGTLLILGLFALCPLMMLGMLQGQGLTIPLAAKKIGISDQNVLPLADPVRGDEGR